MIDYKDLGLRVRFHRRANAMTQEELAEKMGVSTSFIGHIERGNRSASLETLVALCNTLRVSPSLLLQASLDSDLTEQLPGSLTHEERNKLSNFLRFAQDALNNWDV